jgi:oligopeptide transport system permease protein
LIKYILRRLAWILPVLLATLIVVFLLMHAVPGNPWDSSTEKRGLANLSIDPKTSENLSRRYGLNEPLWKQFTSYLVGRVDEKGSFICGLVCGNMGPSYRQLGRTVQDILFSPPNHKTFFETRFAYSLRLSGMAFLLALGIGMPLGILAAVHQGSWIDYGLKTLATVLLAVPNFVIGLLMIIFLGGQLHWIVISPTNWENFDPRVWFAPIGILGITTLASFIRLTRASLLEVMQQDYVRTARGKGASERRLIWLHMLKNAMIPIITFSGPALLELFAGSFVIESMFGFPGMGREFIDSVLRRDYSMIMGVILIYALMIGAVNILVDLLYGWVDPRIRMNQEGL